MTSTAPPITPPQVQPLRARDPQRRGQWRFLGRIGAGGMGTVYLGEHVDTGARAAVKVMSDGLADQPGFRDRFAREIQILQRVQGPFVAAVVDGDAFNELPWLATDYVPGPDLARLVREHGPLDEQSWQGLAAGLLAALARLHDAGVVHRDVKPANILLAADGPRVIDFGVARLLDATALTSTGTALGTPGWLAPEQIRGAPASPQTDSFSAGAVLAFAATGRSPFGGDTTPAAAMHAVLNDSPDLDGVPPRVRRVIEHLLDKDPQTRWTAARAVQHLTGAAGAEAIDQHATQQWHAGDLTRILPTDATILDVAPAQLVDAATAPAAPAVRRRSAGRWIAGVAAAALVAATAGFGGVFVLSGKSERESTAADAGATRNADTGAAADPTRPAAPEPEPVAGPLSQVADTISLSESVNATAFAPDGETVYAASGSCTSDPSDCGEGTISVIDVSSRMVTESYSVPNPAQDVVVSPDGQYLYTANAVCWEGCGDGSVSTIDTTSGRVRNTVDAPTTGEGWQPGMTELAVTSDGERVYAAGDSPMFMVLDGSSGTLVDTFEVPSEQFDAFDMATDADSGDIVVAHADCTYGEGCERPGISKLDRDAEILRPLTTVAGSGLVTSAALAGGTLIASGGSGDGEVSILDGRSGTVDSSVRAAESTGSVALSPDAEYAYATAYDDNGNSALVVIDTATGSIVDRIAVEDYPDTVSVSPDGSTAFVSHRASEEPDLTVLRAA